ncbi:hypothetical protein IMZ11_24795 [Microtetraspora sp. AC03309]|uniref:hypothetical protein n=1 Tax=Microtetraspora sp. AC03309 TaxID=2779376 RepID=UPI001E2E9CBD|nr:hypothetical protein [Microtetraspora sp. AC03309]MCC5578849.1 hypothetical protein [Microtetraspora sp. AC03309]
MKGVHGLGEDLLTRGNDIESSLLAGEHALSVEGDLLAGRRWFDSAYREAERWGDGVAMAHAALGLGGLWVHEHRSAADSAMIRARQRHALALNDAHSALALRLRTRLVAEEEYRTGGHTAALAMVEEARRRGDPVALAEALSLAHHCVLGPEHGTLRLELAQELIAVASLTARRGDLLMGLLWRTVDLLLDADPHAERCLEELRGLLGREGHLATGFVVSAIDVMFSIRDGRFTQAEALASTCAERGAVAGDIDATGWYGAQLVAIRWYQGRIAELLPMLSDLVNSPLLSAVDNSCLAGLAVAAATAGERRPAMSALARLRGHDLADLPRSSSWLLSMYGVVEAAHLLGDVELAARAYDLLLPFARLPIMVSLGAACFGSVQHCLGVTSLTGGDAGRAAEHLSAAIQDNLALGHWPAMILSRWRLGQALALRDGPRDKVARRELDLATREAAALGMALPSAPPYLPSVPPSVPPNPPPSVPPSVPPCTLPPETRRRVLISAGASGDDDGRAPVVALLRRGGSWRIAMGGRFARVGDSVGLRHLAVLLANPGQEIPATDLAAGPGLSDAEPAAGSTTPDQPVLDGQARRAYRERLTRLDVEIDDLESSGRTEHACALRAERDWLAAELASATGLGGRPRPFAGNRERARIAVGKAIRRALDRISEADPVIGDELRATVRTGTRCCYRPE